MKDFSLGKQKGRKTRVSSHAGGITAISRWLSEATPPELIAPKIFES